MGRDPLSTLVRTCQPTALLVLNRLQLVHSVVVSCTSPSLSTLSHSLSLSLFLSHLTFLQGCSKMTRNVARQDRFFPSGQNTTGFKLETLISERNHTHLDGSRASLSQIHSYCNTLTASLKTPRFLRIYREEDNCKYKFNISDLLFPISVCIDLNADRAHVQYISLQGLSESQQLAGQSACMILFLKVSDRTLLSLKCAQNVTGHKMKCVQNVRGHKMKCAQNVRGHMVILFTTKLRPITCLLHHRYHESVMRRVAGRHSTVLCLPATRKHRTPEAQ
jgi:hypothetical protein